MMRKVMTMKKPGVRVPASNSSRPHQSAAAMTQRPTCHRSPCGHRHMQRPTPKKNPNNVTICEVSAAISSVSSHVRGWSCTPERQAEERTSMNSREYWTRSSLRSRTASVHQRPLRIASAAVCCNACWTAASLSPRPSARRPECGTAWCLRIREPRQAGHGEEDDPGQVTRP
jgi:hypothetical protein